MKQSMGYYHLLILSIFMIVAGCSENPDLNIKKYELIEDVPNSTWKKLKGKRIVFGHQSVGENIIEGLNMIIRDNPHIQLKIIETNQFNSLEPGTLAHFPIGENGYPLSKISQFEKLAHDQFGDKVDFAFFKLCFVDITSKTDIAATAMNLVDTLNSIAISFSKTQFILFTCPLTETKITWKTKVKKLLGVGTLWEFEDNVKRNQFNNLISKSNNEALPIFDLANIESINKDGTKSLFEFKGDDYLSLSPNYSLDGGHLNAIGSRKVAEQLIVMIANLL